MIQRFRWKTLDSETRRRVLRRADTDISQLIPDVSVIVDDVRMRGDRAVAEHTNRFDGTSLDPQALRVAPEEFAAARSKVSAQLGAALDMAIANVRRFHETQRESSHTVSVSEGISATERTTPIDSVGLYVPSGRGSFPSMMYMLGVPARIAGVPRIAVVTPPGPDGTVDPAVLYAAESCGITEVYRVGGPQAIAALAYGTDSIPQVRKIIGPGSAWVTAAKRLLSDLVDIGLPAGPSESIVLAGSGADPWLVALDLLIEAEHGSDSAALLVTDDEALADRVTRYVEQLMPDIPEPRRSFLADVFSGYGGIVLTESTEASVAFVDEFAPEHLLIHAHDARTLADQIGNAAEILIGPHTAFSLANYATGANAVLPTGGWARTWSPVSVHDFCKRSTIVEVTRAGFDALAPHVAVLADHEGFHTHAAALRLRDSRPDDPAHDDGGIS